MNLIQVYPDLMVSWKRNDGKSWLFLRVILPVIIHGLNKLFCAPYNPLRLIVHETKAVH